MEPAHVNRNERLAQWQVSISHIYRALQTRSAIVSV